MYILLTLDVRLYVEQTSVAHNGFLYQMSHTRIVSMVILIINIE